MNQTAHDMKSLRGGLLAPKVADEDNRPLNQTTIGGFAPKKNQDDSIKKIGILLTNLLL